MGQQNLLLTLRKLISGMDESLVIFDQDGIILHGSHELQKLLHNEHLIGTSVFDYVVDDEGVFSQELRVLDTSKYVDARVLLRVKEKMIPLRIRMASWKISEKEHLVLASFVDATLIERKRRDLLRKTLTIEFLSKSNKIREGKIHDAIHEILEMSCKAVNSTRVNAWLFDDANSFLEPIGNFDIRVGKMIPQDSLRVMEMPTYFKLFESEKIILVSDAQHSPYTSELNEQYLIPNRIVSMMDIPLRSEGKIIGVICFEQVDEVRKWSLNDQKFGLIAAQMVSLSVETHKRKMLQQELKLALSQQKRLLSESNHRIATNLSLASKLLTIQSKKAKDAYHQNLMEDSVNRIQSILHLHELLSENNLTARVLLNEYIGKIVDSLKETVHSRNSKLQLLHTSDVCEVKSSIGICMGTIINEAVLNAVKHAYSESEIGIIRIDFRMKGPKGVLSISDTGKGIVVYDTNKGSGLEIIRGMVEHLQGELRLDGSTGTIVEVTFPLA